MKDKSIFGAGRLRTAAVCLVVVVSGRTAHGQLPSKRPPMMTAETEEAIENGLKFLASRQSADGSFREMGGMGSYPVAMTALAGLSLMA